MKGPTKKGAKREAKQRLYAAILSGGVGSRFWPLSRETIPKQLLEFAGNESLLKATIRRLNPLVPFENVSIVTSSKQAGIIKLHLTDTEFSDKLRYIEEPVGRNTAPAIGLAALRLLRQDPEAIMAVLPADHLIKDPGAFRKLLRYAAQVAADGHLVTFGITPTTPETGYGYIKASKTALGSYKGYGVKRVERFVEKPDIKKARTYLKSGRYLWNSGIFVWKAKQILEEMEAHLPGVYRELVRIEKGGSIDGAYASMESISIDHGVLERTSKCVVMEATFRWSDMGTWSSINQAIPTDRDGNIKAGRVVDIGSTGSIIMGCDRVIATIGLKDMILVDTPDATLVCPKERAQEVKDLVAMLKKKGWVEHEEHLTVRRPWGSYTVMEHGEGYKVKKIRVEPGRRLSLQKHRKRSEHWVVIAGRAKVQRGKETVVLRTNESTYIPRGVKHRLENPGKTLLEIIEVQNGDYLGEDDIIRYEDDYKRG